MSKLLICLMYKDKEIYNKCLSELKKVFGPFNIICKEYDFNFTDYYEKEMGKDLKKTIVVFKKNIDSKALKRAKFSCSDLEDLLKVNGKRIIIIDPGMMSKKVLYLASFIEGDFKINMGHNVFMHKVLDFEKNKVIENENTPGDFKIGLVHDFFKFVLLKMK